MPNDDTAAANEAKVAPEAKAKKFTYGDRVKFDDKVCKVTAVHESSLYDVQEETAAEGQEARWFQNIAASELTALG